MEIIRENPGVTRRELEGLLSRTPDSIKYHLARLAEQGFIKREGPDKGRRWIVLGE
uniref:winged helix-turn-helix transcriptional regulator n=1 Tax=Alistipes ihumii TaxID=1470347 RepID=UPI003FEE6824